MPKKAGPKQLGPPKNWSDEKKHLFRKMIGNSADDLIRVISKYRNMRAMPPEKTKQAINVAKFILIRRDELTPKDIHEIVAYYEAVGKVVF